MREPSGSRGGPDLLRRLYRGLVRLYPRRFRDEHEADLLQAFDDRRSEPRFQGAAGSLRLAVLLLHDVAVSLPLARRRSGRRRWEGVMGNVLWDLRYAVRTLVKNPLFSAAAIVTLALGIGLNTATFSAVDTLLLKPLPGVERPDRLVQLYRHWAGIEYGSNSIPHYQDVRDRTGDVFESVAAWKFAPMSLSADGRSERLMGFMVSANFFQTYGVQPALGRAFLPDEESVGPGAHPVAVLGHAYWQSRFGGDRDIVGRTIILNGTPFQVVGVAPPEFQGPINITAGPVYVPLIMAPVIEPGSGALEARGSNSMTAVARLHDGITVERAREAMDALLAQLKGEMPRFYENQLGTTMVMQSEAGIHPMFRGAQVAMSTVIMGVVGLLLLIACVNVANLFLARARERRREMGIRLSLGAGRGRIVQQLLTESLVFSAVAGAAGLLLAKVAVRFLDRFRPPIDGPWALGVEMDSTVLLFTLGITVSAGILFGLAPALQAADSDTVGSVKGESSQRSGRARSGSALVVLQMALSILLLISASLFLRSLQAATRIDPGFEDPSSLVTMAMDPGLQGYDEVRAQEFFDGLRAGASRLPGVQAVALADFLPLSIGGSDTSVEIPGYAFAPAEPRNVHYASVSDGYFETMGIDLLAGRVFTAGDDAAGEPVLIVNEAFARRFWPGESAVGKTVVTRGVRRVVGVVETGKYGSLGEEPREFMYYPHGQSFRTGMTLVVRTSREAGETLGSLRQLVRDADPDLPVFDVRTVEDHLGTALLPARIGGSVLGFFGVLGLLLAAVGVYGVMAYSVSRRSREMGIRVAMGADRNSLLKLVVGEGLKLTLVGAALGLGAGIVAARLVSGLLYNVTALDPVAFVGVPLLLMGVATLAVWLPARRAARVDPMRALKAE